MLERSIVGIRKPIADEFRQLDLVCWGFQGAPRHPEADRGATCFLCVASPVIFQGYIVDRYTETGQTTAVFRDGR